MVWKTTLSFLFTFIKIELLKERSRVILLLLVTFFATFQSVWAQGSVNCNIDVVGCPPTDIVETCGNVSVENVLGNYVKWTEPDYSLDCGAETGYQYEISFDLPESKENCWTFSKVQRVGNNGGTLQLWQSTGTTTNPVVTSPSFFINGIMDGSMEIVAPVGENFEVRLSLISSDGTVSNVLNSFQVNGSNILQSYHFSIDPASFDNSDNYDRNIFKIKFEFVPITPISNGTKKYVELITLDAGLFGAACAAEANFAVVKTHNPGDFFPTGTTTVTYTATCNGCVPAVSESCSFDVVVKPMPAIPVAETFQPNCETATGSIKIKKVPGIQYNFNGQGFSPTTDFLDLNPGSYSIIAKNSGGCESDPLIIEINAQPETPAMPEVVSTTQPTCTVATGAFSITAVSGMVYSLNGGAFGSNTSWTELASGVYTVVAKNSSECVSEALSVRINEQPATPPTPEIASTTQPTCTVATGSFSITAVSGMVYRLNGGVFGSTTTWKELAPGVYTVVAKSSSECVSEELSVTIKELPSTPAVPNLTEASQPTCESATGSFTITEVAGMTYSFNGGTFGSTTSWAELAPGFYTVVAKNSSECFSEALSVTINAQPATPAEPALAEVSQPTCESATGSFSITAVSGMVYSLNGGAFGSNTSWTELAPGVYTVVAKNSSECVSEALSVTINAQPTNPAAPILAEVSQPTCESATGSFIITEVAGITYSFNGGAFGITTSWTELAPGVYTVVAKNSDECVSEELSVTINEQPANPAAPSLAEVSQPTCESATGSFIITEVAGITYSFNGGAFGITTSWTELAPGVYTVVAKNSDKCVSEALSVTINAQPANPAAPSLAEVSQPTCESATGSFSITAVSGMVYSLNGGVFGSTTTWVKLAPGVYTVVAKNSSECVSEAFSLTINAQPANPAAPILAEVSQPTCESATGSFSITAVSGMVYSLNGGAFGSTTTWAELAPGVYTVVAKNSSECISEALSVTINAQPATPAAPILAEVSQPTCESATGSFSITAVSGMVYSLNGGAFGSTTTWAELAPGVYTVVAKNSSECVSEELSVTINSQPATPAEPALAEVSQPTCESATGSFSITALSGMVYSLNGGAFGSTTSWTELAPGVYTVVAKNFSECVSKALSVTIIEYKDSTAPADITIADATGECEVTLVAPTTSDNCSGKITGTTTDPLTYTEQGNFKVTWTFDDGNGNTTTSVQNVIVNDVTAPVEITIADATGECEVTVTAPTTSDNCSGTIAGTTSDPLTYTEQGNYKVTWTFDDGNGNTTNSVQNIIVNDVTAPVVPEIAEAVGQCSVTVTAPTTQDACGGIITGTTNDPLSYDSEGNYEIEWSFNDGNGNTTTSVQNVTVDDATAPSAPVLADAIGECEVNLTAPTTTDDCTGDIITGTTTDPRTYTKQGNYKVTWTFDDGNGNTTTSVQNVIVNDVTAPVVPEIADAVDQCSVTVTAPTTQDACGGIITGTTNDPLSYNSEGNYEIEWSFNDGNGNTTTSVQNVIVDDVTAPEARTIADATGECEVTVSAPTTSDNCGGTITGTTSDLMTYTEQGNYQVTWTFNDGNGNTTTSVQNVVVNDVTAPEAITIADATGECEVTVTAPTTSDNCSGTITGTTTDSMTYTEQGNYQVTWTFNDGNGNTTTSVQNVVVNDVTAPEAITLADATGECEVTVIAPTTSDNCSGTITGTTSDPLTYTEQGSYKVTWTFDDENGNTTTAVQNVIVDDVTAPEAVIIANATGECDVTVSAPTTSDNCSGTITGTTTDPLIYTEQGNYQVTWTFDDGNGNITTSVHNVIVDDVTAPTAITIADATGECEVTVTAPTTSDNCSGTITGTTSDPLIYSEQGTYEIIWTFSDDNGNTTTSVQNVVVNDVTAPEAITIADATGECEVTVSAPTTSDNCSGTITGTTTDPLSYSEQGNYQVTWTFDDGNGNITTSVQNLIVEDVTIPAAITIADATGECEVTVIAPATSDNCSGTITGTTTDPLTYSEQGYYKVTWTFDDGNGNTTTSVQNVVVNDVTAPEAITIADATGECEVTVTAPTTSDNCSGMIIGTTSDPLTYTEQGSYEITWTFNDGNGNITTSVQNVIVDDVTAPEAITIADATGECEVTVSAPTTTDNCSGTITGTTSDPLTYTEQGNYQVTWTFDDGNGNTTTSDQNVIVDDVTAPAEVKIADATGECEVTVAAPTTSDNCSGKITGTTSDLLTYTEQGNYQITWTFNDGNRNTTTSVQNVILNDVTAPEAITIADATGECEVTVTAPTTSDNCSGTITGKTSDTLNYTEQGNYQVTWTFDDGNGNTTTSVQNVIVDDVTVPEAITIADATGECEVIVTAPTTSDNCSGTITGTTSDPLTYNEQGNYRVTWTFDDGNGNITTSVQNVIVDGISAPVVADVVQPNCEVATGSFNVTTVDGLEYTIDGENFSASGSFEGLEPGVYTVAAINEAGCLSRLTEVVINETASLPAPAIATTVQPTCEINTGSFTVAVEEGISYSIDGTNYQSGVEFSNLAPGTYNVTAQNEAGCISPATIITIEESAVAEPIGDTTKSLCVEDQTFDLFDLYNDEIDESGTWGDPGQTGALSGSIIDPTLLEVGNYNFTYVSGGDCPSTTTVAVSINDDCVVLDCDFESIKNGISKVVTPGTDTFNDFFVVDEDRECGFTYGLQIFNRWGAEVYSSSNYDNGWNGYSSKSVTGSNQLPSGTYFYIVQIDGGTFEPIQGYIYLGTK